MRRIRSIFGAFLLIIPFFGMAQTSVFTGYIKDSITMAPILNAEIIIDNTSSVSTDRYGFFSFPLFKNTCEIHIRHIGYHPIKTQITKAQSGHAFFLSPANIDLTGVEVRVQKPKEILQGKKYHILDYEFYEGKIILLGLEKQSIFSPVLLLANVKGDTLDRVKAPNAIALDKYFDGNIYMLTHQMAYKVTIDSNGLSYSEPLLLEEYHTIKNAIVSKHNRMFYLKASGKNNQLINYFSYDEETENLNLFTSVCDEENLKNCNMGYYFGGKEEDIRFRELIILRPIFSPLLFVNDTLVLFNFTNSKIELFDTTTKQLESKNINFHKCKGMVNECFVDFNRNKVYFMFRKNGISTLKEIDVKNGIITNSISIPEFVFIENIKINDGVVYFLYKEKINEEYKKLFYYKT